MERKERRQEYYWLSFGCSSLFLSALFLLYLHVLFLNERNERVTNSGAAAPGKTRQNTRKETLSSSQHKSYTSHLIDFYNSFQASHKHLHPHAFTNTHANMTWKTSLDLMWLKKSFAFVWDTHTHLLGCLNENIPQAFIFYFIVLHKHYRTNLNPNHKSNLFCTLRIYEPFSTFETLSHSVHFWGQCCP